LLLSVEKQRRTDTDREWVGDIVIDAEL